jgi:hypothetical protein
MTIGLRAEGTFAVLIADAVVPTIPAATQAGDMMILLAAGKPSNTAVAETGGAGWSLIGQIVPAVFVATSAADLGTVIVTAWYKEHDGSEVNPTVTHTTSDVQIVVVHSFTKTAAAWTAPVGAGSDMAVASTSYSVANLNVAVAAGDMVLNWSGFRSDAATPLVAVMGQTTPGITYAAGTKLPLTDPETALAFDMGSTGSYQVANSGTSSGNSTVSGTLPAAHTGTSIMIRLREVAPAPKSLLPPPYPHRGLIMRGNR